VNFGCIANRVQDHAIQEELPEIRRQLDLIFNRAINAHDFDFSVFRAAVILEIPPPTARRRIECLRW
jgi:hypothetical protein